MSEHPWIYFVLFFFDNWAPWGTRGRYFRYADPALGYAGDRRGPFWPFFNHLVAIQFLIIFWMPFWIDFGSILDPNLAPKINQNRSKIDAKMPSHGQTRPQEASRCIQDAHALLQDRESLPKRPPHASTTPNVASKILQSARQLPQNSTSLPGSCQVLANFQSTPGMFVPRGQARWLTVKFVAVYQGCSGGGSPA